MTLTILAVCLSLLGAPASIATLSRSQASAIIRGNVYDNRFGLPVSGAKATALSEGRIQQETTTDQAGGYEFKNLSEGQYTILVHSLGFARAELTVDLRKGEQIVSDIPLRIGRLHDPLPIEISGTARFPDNTVSCDVNILVISPVNQEIIARTKTNHFGYFAAKVDDPGQYVLYAFKSGFEVIAFPIVEPSLPRRPYSKDIVLYPLNLK